MNSDITSPVNESTKSGFKAGTLWKIRGKKEWDIVSSGKIFSTSSLWIRSSVSAEHSNDPVRFACAISKKYGNAVARNTLKRRAKNALRDHVAAGKIPSGTLILLGVSRSQKGVVSFADVQLCFEQLSNKCEQERHESQ